MFGTRITFCGVEFCFSYLGQEHEVEWKVTHMHMKSAAVDGARTRRDWAAIAGTVSWVARVLQLELEDVLWELLSRIGSSSGICYNKRRTECGSKIARSR